MTDRLELQSVREREVKCGQFVILVVEWIVYVPTQKCGWIFFKTKRKIYIADI